MKNKTEHYGRLSLFSLLPPVQCICLWSCKWVRLFEKPVNDRHNPFVGVFDDIMSAILKPVNLGVRPMLDQAFQALGSKAPIAHAPNQRNR